jgi:hypothetical protein
MAMKTPKDDGPGEPVPLRSSPQCPLVDTLFVETAARSRRAIYMAMKTHKDDDPLEPVPLRSSPQ